MQKAYDVKELQKRLLATGVAVKGLSELENLVRLLVPVLFIWARESLILKGGIVNRLIVMGLDRVEAMVLKEVDKIDGVNGA